MPTPGRHNRLLVSNAPPQFSSVSHSPQQPRHGERVVVTARATDSDGIVSMRLLYQAVLPGQYISILDPAYQTNWTPIEMQPQGDGTFTAEMPMALSVHRTLVRYRIEAMDRTGRGVLLPYADDPQPNFAYMVYHGVPFWPASLVPGGEQLRFDFGTMRPLPVYLFLAREQDIADAFFMPPSALLDGYMGNEYLWRGTFVYNGQVYDHVSFRARGGQWRYATGKTMWKINFLPGHRLQAYDNFGRPYPVKWDKLNLTSTLQHSHRNRRGEAGMFESITYRLFQLAGVPASSTHWVHLRVIDSPYEISGSQYTGDFWGLYLAVEQPDGAFLEHNELPDGNLYKMEGGSGELNNLGRAGPADKSDLDNFLSTYQSLNPSADWWRDTLDLESYYSYRSIIEATHHYDIDQGKNYIYYRNPEANRWMVFPWDVDLTWYEKMPGTGAEPFAAPVLGRLEFNLEYQNRLRELRDLLLNPEQMNQLLDEHANIIDSPADGLSMVDADRYMWDYHPIYDTRYVIPRRSQPGTFYISTEEQTFRAMVEEMKRYAAERFAWIDAALLTDHDHPETPSIAYIGSAGYPVDGLRFRAGDYNDPQGADTFGAMEWRVAEVTNPAAPAFDPDAPRIYEVQATWESGPQSAYERTLTLLPGVVVPGHAYRVRVRYSDNTGRWGHWSAPIEFVAGNPATPVSTALQLSEIMYHPLPDGNTPEDLLEFIEIVNTSNAPVALDNMRLTGGVQFDFPIGAVLAGDETMILARDADAFVKRYRFSPFARYDGKLANGGDTITLLDAYRRTLFNVTYDDKAPWPESADGAGYSLAYNPLMGDPDNPAAWRASLAVHGSPGEPDPVPVRINEVLLSPAAQRAVELYNPTDTPADVSSWFISNALADLRKVRLPEGTIVPAGGYRVIPASVLETGSFDGRMTIDPTGAELLYLNSATPSGRLTSYRDEIRVPVTEEGVSVGRIVDSLGTEHVVALAQPTLGAANSQARVGPLVISEILYRPLTGTEYVELASISNAPLPLYDAASDQGWLLQGGAYALAPGLTLPPGGRVLLTSLPAHEACVLYGDRGYVRILGPMGVALADGGQHLQVLKPVTITGAGDSYATVDDVNYGAESSWPQEAATQGAALRRVNLTSFGSDPANWVPVSSPPGAVVSGTTPAICSLVVEQSEGGYTVRWTLSSAQDVSGFRLWRNSRPDRNGAVDVPLNFTASSAGDDGPVAPLTLYEVLDQQAPVAGAVYYFLDVVTSTGTLELGVTGLQKEFRFTHLPIAIR